MEAVGSIPGGKKEKGKVKFLTVREAKQELTRTTAKRRNICIHYLIL